ncbi:hypothetical protein B0H19DRAFT_1176024 [Mycena capillaripes]|nr:hypothetical protein B0H19DRAFT_1176024 [Mycena capillaripes]
MPLLPAAADFSSSASFCHVSARHRVPAAFLLIFRVHSGPLHSLSMSSRPVWVWAHSAL